MTAGSINRNNRQIGADYEALAALYLEQRGYRILERNYRNCYGEIDIIAEKENTIVFCEVKYRGANRYGSPLEAVDYREQKRISKAALYYTTKNKSGNVYYRFDVIGIDKEGQMEHIENAFYFQG